MLQSTHFSYIGEYDTTYSAFYIPSTLGQMQGHVPEVRYSTDTHNLSPRCPVDEMPLTRSENGQTLTGTWTSGSYTCTAEYTFE